MKREIIITFVFQILHGSFQSLLWWEVCKFFSSDSLNTSGFDKGALLAENKKNKMCFRNAMPLQKNYIVFFDNFGVTGKC